MIKTEQYTQEVGITNDDYVVHHNDIKETRNGTRGVLSRKVKKESAQSRSRKHTNGGTLVKNTAKLPSKRLSLKRTDDKSTEEIPSIYSVNDHLQKSNGVPTEKHGGVLTLGNSTLYDDIPPTSSSLDISDDENIHVDERELSKPAPRGILRRITQSLLDHKIIDEKSEAITGQKNVRFKDDDYNEKCYNPTTKSSEWGEVIKKGAYEGARKSQGGDIGGREHVVGHNSNFNVEYSNGIVNEDGWSDEDDGVSVGYVGSVFSRYGDTEKKLVGVEDKSVLNHNQQLHENVDSIGNKVNVIGFGDPVYTSLGGPHEGTSSDDEDDKLTEIMVQSDGSLSYNSLVNTFSKTKENIPSKENPNQKTECVYNTYTLGNLDFNLDSFEINTFFNEMPIRIVGSHDRPMFYSSDVADILGIKNIRQNLVNFNEREIVSKQEKDKNNIITFRTDGKRHDRIILLTEFGMYRLLANNNSELGYKFREWLYDVLYKIRTTGEYKSKAEIQKLKTINEQVLKANGELVAYNQQLKLKRSEYQNLCERLFVFEINVDPRIVRQSRNLAEEDQSSEESFEQDGYDYIDYWDAYKAAFPDDAAERSTAYKVTKKPCPYDYGEYDLVFSMFVRDADAVLQKLGEELYQYNHAKKTDSSLVLFCSKEKVLYATKCVIESEKK